MVQMMTSLLWKSYHKKIYTYGSVMILMISLCFFQFQNQNLGKSNFWIWQLYLNSDLYTAIVGFDVKSSF